MDTEVEELKLLAEIEQLGEYNCRLALGSVYHTFSRDVDGQQCSGLFLSASAHLTEQVYFTRITLLLPTDTERAAADANTHELRNRNQELREKLQSLKSSNTHPVSCSKV